MATVTARPRFKALLADFPRRRGAWRVLATNLIPVAGVLALGWSTALIVFAYWLDVVLATMALTAVLTVHAMDDALPHVRGLHRWLGMIAFFAFITPFLNLPAIVFGGFAYASMPGLLEPLRAIDKAAMAGFGAMFALHLAAAVRWLQREDRRAVRDETREVFGLMIFKAMTFWLIGSHAGFVLALLGRPGQALLVLLLSAILTVAEVYRPELLSALGVNRTFHDACEANSVGDGKPAQAGTAKIARRRGSKGT